MTVRIKRCIRICVQGVRVAVAGTASNKAGATPEKKREENAREMVVGRRDVLQLPPVDLFGLFTGVAFDGKFICDVYMAQ